jgi:hypothetical protein
LFFTLGQLDVMHAAGDEDYAASVREEMARLGIAPNAR